MVPLLLLLLPVLGVVLAAKTRHYELEITWETKALDGFAREMLLVNGATPGPEIELDEGDYVVVCVVNKSPQNVTIHWHGIEMKDTPWADGVPGVSQRPILPGSSFVYEWAVTQYGTYWYHAHFKGQIEDGLYGAIQIRPKPGCETPFHLMSSDAEEVKAIAAAVEKSERLLIYDLNHLTSEEKFDFSVSTGIEEVCYDAILFNGKGRVICHSQEELEASINPAINVSLTLAPGTTISDKGCVSPNVMYALGMDTAAKHHPVPPNIYSGCNATDAEIEIITVEVDTWIALDIIASVNFISPRVSVDEHDMWLYALDGSYIEPIKIQVIDTFNAGRYSVLIKTHTVGDFQIRANEFSAIQILTGNAILRVEGGSSGNDSCTCGGGHQQQQHQQQQESKPFIDIGGNVIPGLNVTLFDQANAHPFPPSPIPAKADALRVFDMTPISPSYLWALNATSANVSVESTRSTPVLFLDPSTDLHDNITFSTLNGTWQDLVFNSNSPLSHSVHKHGSKMYIVGQGVGTFNWSSIEEAAAAEPERFNLVNPPMRDTFPSAPAPGPGMNAWTAAKYFVANPGAWLIHCHIDSHLVGGMMVVIRDGVDEWPEVPPEYLNWS